jgi:hypothetical protein
MRLEKAFSFPYSSDEIEVMCKKPRIPGDGLWRFFISILMRILNLLKFIKRAESVSVLNPSLKLDN